MTDDEATDWRARLEAAVEATLRRRAAKRDLRRALDSARDAGLRRRHADKLARNRRPEGPRP
jgi:hypothetical protein